MKTRLFKYIENFTTKNGKFSDKTPLRGGSNGYSLKTPLRGGSNEYPQYDFEQK